MMLMVIKICNALTLFSMILEGIPGCLAIKWNVVIKIINCEYIGKPQHPKQYTRLCIFWRFHGMFNCIEHTVHHFPPTLWWGTSIYVLNTHDLWRANAPLTKIEFRKQPWSPLHLHCVKTGSNTDARLTVSALWDLLNTFVVLIKKLCRLVIFRGGKFI